MASEMTPGLLAYLTFVFEGFWFFMFLLTADFYGTHSSMAKTTWVLLALTPVAAVIAGLILG